MTVGVAGLGAMGRPMAENLARAGFAVTGFDVRPDHHFTDFEGTLIADPAAFAADADIVFSVVRDIAETEALLFDDQAILKAPAPPRILALSSTLSPRYILDVAKRVPTGVAVVDAPMSGAPYRARAGTLTFMVGGDAAPVAEIMPLLRAMGEHVHHLGPTGAGAATKVANNLCAAAGVVAVRHALQGAAAYGITAYALLEVMRTSSGTTWYGDNLDRIDWAREGYDPANTIGILEKDVSSFVDAVSGIDGLDGAPFESGILASLRKLKPLP